MKRFGQELATSGFYVYFVVVIIDVYYTCSSYSSKFFIVVSNWRLEVHLLFMEVSFQFNHQLFLISF